MPSSCWSQFSLLSLPIHRRWEVVWIKQNIESKTREQERRSVIVHNPWHRWINTKLLHPSPKLPDHRNIAPDHHLATLATQTKVIGRLIEENLCGERQLLLCSCTEKEGRTMKYCLVHVMYCTRSSGVASSGTRINEGAAFSSVTRSTVTAINGSDSPRSALSVTLSVSPAGVETF